jgi:hypothetical protein
MPKRTYIRAGGTWVDITTGAAFPAQSAAPTSPVTGQVYFDTDDQKPYIWNGSAWSLFTPALTDSTSTTSSTTAASATAVKAAYDRGSQGVTDAATAQSTANAAIPKSTVTTAGDLVYGTGSSTVTRLGIGSAGQVLTVNAGATAPSWATPASGSGSSLATPNPQTSTPYVLLTSDLDKMVEMNLATANQVTVGTGLNSLAAGSQIHILQTGAGQTTIAGSSVTVNATPGLKLRTQWSAATLVKRTAANVTPGVWVAFGDLTA